MAYDGEKFLFQEPQIVKYLAAAKLEIQLFELDKNKIKVKKINNFPELIAKALTLCSGYSSYNDEYINIGENIRDILVYRLEKIYE